MKNFLLFIAVVFTVQGSAIAQTTTTNTHHRHHSKHGSMHKSAGDTRMQHNIKVSDNDDHAAYEGKSSHSNDGVKRNKERNMNYQNNGAQLPPSNGGNSK